MGRLFIIGVLFVLAGLCEIGGGYLVWGWMREHKPLAWALLGALILAAYGVVAALQPILEFGRVYAAYGGVFIALALAWGVLVDGFTPDRWDLLGAAICVVGSLVVVAPPRGSPRPQVPTPISDSRTRLASPSPVIRSQTGPSSRSNVSPNSKKGQHSRSLATNSAKASSTVRSGECLKA